MTIVHTYNKADAARTELNKAANINQISPPLSQPADKLSQTDIPKFSGTIFMLINISPADSSQSSGQTIRGTDD